MEDLYCPDITILDSERHFDTTMWSLALLDVLIQVKQRNGKKMRMRRSLDSIKTINDSVKLDEQRILREAEVTT